MRLRDEVLTVRTGLELFPFCLRCGQDMSAERLSNVVQVMERNRFTHLHCPPLTAEATDAAAKA